MVGRQGEEVSVLKDSVFKSIALGAGWMDQLLQVLAVLPEDVS